MVKKAEAVEKPLLDTEVASRQRDPFETDTWASCAGTIRC